MSSQNLCSTSQYLDSDFDFDFGEIVITGATGDSNFDWDSDSDFEIRDDSSFHKRDFLGNFHLVDFPYNTAEISHQSFLGHNFLRDDRELNLNSNTASLCSINITSPSLSDEMISSVEDHNTHKPSALLENSHSVETSLGNHSVGSDDAHKIFDGNTHLNDTTNYKISITGNNEASGNDSITQIRILMNNGKSRGLKRRRPGASRDEILALLRCELDDENLVRNYIKYYDEYGDANGNPAIEDSILLKAFASNIVLKKTSRMTIFQIGSETYKLIMNKLKTQGTEMTITRKPLGNGKQLTDADLLNFRGFFEAIPLSTSFMIQDDTIKSYKALYEDYKMYCEDSGILRVISYESCNKLRRRFFPHVKVFKVSSKKVFKVRSKRRGLRRQ
jgi:hypothetical protein